MARIPVFIFAFLFTVLTLLPLEVDAATFEDTRCKCVCSKTKDANGKESRAVFRNTTRSEQCDCDHVVRPVAPTLSCSLCQCKTETRNTTTIKVVVIFIICVVSLLFVYMLFLLCLDPLLQKRPAKSYQQHTNEEVNMRSHSLNSTSADEGEDLSQRQEGPTAGASNAQLTESLSARQRSLLNIVTKEQKKWKGTVQEQRRNIYDRHSMLN